MIETRHHEGVAELRLARPPVNALSPALVDELSRALDEVLAADDAVVLSGREGLFSAGLDVVELMQLDRAGIRDFWRAFFGLLEQLARAPKPVAAAITGHSPAGGAVLALFCDYRVMAEGEFAIGLNEVQVGLTVPAVICRALARQVGPRPAERLLVAGRMMSPADARAIGLIDETAPVDRVVEHAIAWCRAHLALPRAAMLSTRALARADLAALFDAEDALRLDEFTEGWFRDESQQTLRALVQRLKDKKA